MSDGLYAGDVSPEEAWNILAKEPEAVLVDCRTDAEWNFVGVPDLYSLGKQVALIPWRTTANLLTKWPLKAPRLMLQYCFSAAPAPGREMLPWP
jgi:rhodanese-related sulfurtransferase